MQGERADKTHKPLHDPLESDFILKQKAGDISEVYHLLACLRGICRSSGVATPRRGVPKTSSPSPSEGDLSHQITRWALGNFSVELTHPESNQDGSQRLFCN
ncbi:hypothetical protein TNIN_158941 [Trichonephila inaurata madagascariensis]|uniref:Uncharacterized protein n=1 Tax=Trichonephila inaurata madagascariensis TaxID=2747483 RepID=A0A8X6X314_9ARAC|nr:hypothetical protein TNIN_158941 [Trichonephila inaurata madagascariensis]